MKVIKEFVIGQTGLTELDFVVQDELLGENPDGHDYGEDYVWIGDDSNPSQYWKEGDHCPIDLLLKTINDFKAKGATHIQICQHGDHHGYYLTGSKMEVVSEEKGIELRKENIQKEIQIAEGQYEQNRYYLAQEMDKIGKLYEELERLNGNAPEEREE